MSVIGCLPYRHGVAQHALDNGFGYFGGTFTFLTTVIGDLSSYEAVCVLFFDIENLVGILSRFLFLSLKIFSVLRARFHPSSTM